MSRISSRRFVSRGDNAWYPQVPGAGGFCDGVVTVFSVRDVSAAGSMPVLELTQKVKLRFANKTVGFRRHYAAMQAGERITRVVKVPGPPISAPGDAARIAGDPDTLYFVTLVQPIAGSSPPVTELTLDEAEPNGARVVEATPPAEAGAPSEKGPG